MAGVVQLLREDARLLELGSGRPLGLALLGQHDARLLHAQHRVAQVLCSNAVCARGDDSGQQCRRINLRNIAERCHLGGIRCPSGDEDAKDLIVVLREGDEGHGSRAERARR